MAHYVSTRDVHECAHKVRLTEADDELVRALARRQDQPVAVLLRSWIVERLHQVSVANVDSDSRAA